MNADVDIDHRQAISALHCPNCKALVQCAGNGTIGSPWTIPDHVSPVDGEPCQESRMRWTRHREAAL